MLILAPLLISSVSQGNFLHLAVNKGMEEISDLWIQLMNSLLLPIFTGKDLGFEEMQCRNQEGGDQEYGKINNGVLGDDKVQDEGNGVLLKENQNVQGRHKSYTVLMFGLCLCVQAGGRGAEWGTARKLVCFLYGSLGNRVYSGEQFLLPNMKTTIIGYWQQWALLDMYISSHWSVQLIQLQYLFFFLQMYMSKQSINIMSCGNQCHDSLTKR